MRKLIDTHCHVYDEAFREDLPLVIERAVQAGLEYLLLPNINPDTLADLLRVCDTWPELCRPMIGLHPEDLADDFHGQLDGLKAILDDDRKPQGRHRFIGIGETGLDLYWDKSRLDDQIESFRIQNSVLSDYRNCGLRGIFHCFSGSADEARALLEFEGFMFGIGGVLTYKKSLLPSVLPVIPLDRVVLETDCPYLSPVPFRGKRHEPSYIVNTAAVMAQTYGISADELTQVTSDNACRLFGL